jgi:hypothetical protein
MKKLAKSLNTAFINLEVPSKDKLNSNPSLQKALLVKEDSEKKSCNKSNNDDLFAYSGHNDYSS